MNKNHKKIVKYIVKNLDLDNKHIIKLDEKSIVIIDGNITLYFTIKNNEVVFLSPLKNVFLGQ
ncbi:TPA: hypothetical protein P1K40_000330 [Clostridioides difficile]|nr:hypothetical protein [Clostridioides difficile]